MPKMYAIQKAKRKRQRRRHQNQPMKHPKTENKPFDASVLLIHGIGNQKPSMLIDKWGASIVEEIERLSSQKGWSFETNTSAEGKVISIKKNENSYTISLSECIWSNEFERPGRREMFSWIIGRLPAFLFLLLPDSREAERLFDDDKNILGTRFVVHFMIRFLLFVGIASWTLWSIYTVLQWAASRASHSEAEFIALTVLMTVITVLAIKFHSHWNLAGHVKVVSELNSEETKKITRFVQNRIEDVHLQSLKTTVVAHSQGGLLAHMLSPTLLVREHPSYVSLVSDPAYDRLHFSEVSEGGQDSCIYGVGFYLYSPLFLFSNFYSTSLTFHVCCWSSLD